MRLLLLLLPLGLFADVINLKCKWDSKLDMTTGEKEELELVFKLEVDTRRKTVFEEDFFRQPYKEIGEFIVFEFNEALGSLQYSYEYTVNRLNGYADMAYYFDNKLISEYRGECIRDLPLF